VLCASGAFYLIHPWIGLLALGVGAVLLGVSLELGAKVNAR
jgi:hypothetical protein